MLHFVPKDQRAYQEMCNRIGLLLLFIFFLFIFYYPNFISYGGIGFVSYEEAFNYYKEVLVNVFQSLTSGDVVLLPTKLAFLPFLFSVKCHRPTCEWAGMLFIVAYYTFMFYLIIFLAHKLSKKKVEQINR